LRFSIGALAVVVVFGIAVLGWTRYHGQNESSVSPVPTQSEILSEPPPPPKPQKQWIEAKGLHVTGWIAGSKNSFAHLIDLCNKTELNTLVIDVKDSDGIVSYDTNVPLEREMKASARAIADIESVMKQMADNNIYPIARIAVFKDPIVAKKRPDLAVLKADGSIWTDNHRTGWANPYKRDVWDYNIAIAKDAAERGFKEIQWDYVRFPSDGRVSACIYPGKTEQTESEVIADFLKYAKQELEPYGVVISADIFGLTSLVKHDMGIGQTIKLMAEHVDYICPMVYPSHYARGEYGIPNPDVQPYKTVSLSLADALKSVEGTDCKVRPWLQDFSLRARYGKAEVLAQRKAAEELGITEFLLGTRGSSTPSPLCRRQSRKVKEN
jgi:hypothetical protein